MVQPQAAPTVKQLNAARQAAGMLRARTLTRVAVGQITPEQVIAAAAKPNGVPLRRISVRKLLASQPGWGDTRVGRVTDHLRRALPGCPPRPTIGWLLDPRVSNPSTDRLTEFASVAGPHRVDVPWTGWPYVPAGVE